MVENRQKQKLCAIRHALCVVYEMEKCVGGTVLYNSFLFLIQTVNRKKIYNFRKISKIF